MDLFSILTMIGGLVLFLYGMNAMGEGLSKVSGGRLEGWLERLTSTPIKAVLLGAAVTAVIQSSSATTVMIVGFVNSGIMRLSQAIGIIMGANIGTTVTSWILSLSGIQSDNFFIKLLKPSSFAPILGAVGIVFLLFLKNEKKKNIGEVFLGFAVLMTGMQTMSGAVEPLADVPEFTHILTMFSNPLLGLLAGAVLTGIIQSSSASVGILQALCMTGSVSFGTAIPIIMGQNIGTCVTALLSAIGASKNAKRTALVHLYFNLIGTTVFMIVFYTLNAFIHFAFLGNAANAAGIAIVHSAFNIGATVLLLPFAKGLESLAMLTIREDDQIEKIDDFQTLDERFLNNPAFAVEQCRGVTYKMASLCKMALYEAFSLLDGGSYTDEIGERIQAMENKVDRYEDELGTYLVRLSRYELSKKDSQRISLLLHSIGDLERMSDHAVNLMESAQEIKAKDMIFSESAAKELHIFTEALRDIVDRTIRVFQEEDCELAKTVEPLEDTIDALNNEIKAHHIERLKDGQCTIELGFVLSDISTNYERIADHCSNIAVCQIQLPKNEYDAHEYMIQLKNKNNSEFFRKEEEFIELYRLPE